MDRVHESAIASFAQRHCPVPPPWMLGLKRRYEAWWLEKMAEMSEWRWVKRIHEWSTDVTQQLSWRQVVSILPPCVRDILQHEAFIAIASFWLEFIRNLFCLAAFILSFVFIPLQVLWTSLSLPSLSTCIFLLQLLLLHIACLIYVTPINRIRPTMLRRWMERAREVRREMGEAGAGGLEGDEQRHRRRLMPDALRRILQATGMKEKAEAAEPSPSHSPSPSPTPPTPSSLPPPHLPLRPTAAWHVRYGATTSPRRPAESASVYVAAAPTGSGVMQPSPPSMPTAPVRRAHQHQFESSLSRELSTDEEYDEVAPRI